MKALGEALKLLLAKVADFLDLFDLSLVVSGALGFTAIWLWLTLAKVSLPRHHTGSPQ
jgi:hypothetical protein